MLTEDQIRMMSAGKFSLLFIWDEQNRAILGPDGVAMRMMNDRGAPKRIDIMVCGISADSIYHVAYDQVQVSRELMPFPVQPKEVSQIDHDARDALADRFIGKNFHLVTKNDSERHARSVLTLLERAGFCINEKEGNPVECLANDLIGKHLCLDQWQIAIEYADYLLCCLADHGFTVSPAPVENIQDKAVECLAIRLLGHTFCSATSEIATNHATMIVHYLKESGLTFKYGDPTRLLATYLVGKNASFPTRESAKPFALDALRYLLECGYLLEEVKPS